MGNSDGGESRVQTCNVLDITKFAWTNCYTWHKAQDLLHSGVKRMQGSQFATKKGAATTKHFMIIESACRSSYTNGLGSIRPAP